MNFDKKMLWKIGLSAFLLFLAIYYWNAVSGFLSVLIGATAPLVIGLVIAFILNILMSFYERHYFPKRADKPAVARSRRPVCLAAAFLTLVAIVAAVVWLVIPELVSCLKFLAAEIPPALTAMLQNESLRSWLPENFLAQLATVDWESITKTAIDFFASGIGDAANTVVAAITSVFSGITTAFIGLIFSFYLLASKERLQGQCLRVMKHYLRPSWTEKLLYVLHVANENFRGYIIGQCTEAVILGVLCMIGMLICGFPYAGMIGALVGFTALVPIAGAFIGAIVGAVMILTVSPLKAVLFVVFFVVLQQLEGNLIYPRVVGKSIGLPALWVLVGVTVGGSLMGIGGMLLAVPLLSVIYRLIREDMARREQ
ncbi:MAG: AI-2E family transporter [Clostridia bacterium]|nr:AI-2E family transporter [Clostridia bacterium]